MGNETALGAHLSDATHIRLRVWAPQAAKLEVETYPAPDSLLRHEMVKGEEGLWSADLEGQPGLLYRYRLDEEWGYPDPYSRSQPEGVHGPSQVVDPSAFAWTDDGWQGLDRDALVIYELHVGAYTAAGTFDALIPELASLTDLGVSAIELMPVNEFPGRRNWGYDGVSLFAPSNVYGGPEGLRRLVDAAHQQGLGVILDVVYNHFGPDGNYLAKYSDSYFTNRYQTPWGDALNFDGEGSEWTRRLVIDSALMWFDEYHIDGLRLDATQEIYDSSKPHLLRELGETTKKRWPSKRRPILIAEHENNQLRIVTPRESDGYGLDGLWLDDFHHSAHVLLTGERNGYLGRFRGTTEEVGSILGAGALYEQDQARVLPPERFLFCLQNHDQVGNRPQGERLGHLIDLELYKAAYTLLLLSPYIPLIFMGDEFAASSPFLFFTDHKPELAEQIRASRQDEFAGVWPGVEIVDPQAEEAFVRSHIDLSERERPPHNGVWRLFRELLGMRGEIASAAGLEVVSLADQVIGMARGEGDAKVAVVANFGDEARVKISALAGASSSLRATLCTADAQFSGPGVDLAELSPGGDGLTVLPARAAVVWRPGV
ncbi:MAG: malto-oligosyltrehalose trehalohydrolase [Chloroflexi bacterium]|nr:malto-oligosyltrehalose trehalohydrolase [Chloroflexota bacterium]